MKFAKLSEVKVGTILKTDGGFTCMSEGELKVVQKNGAGELFIICCDKGAEHLLDGQIKGDHYVGLYLA